MKTQFPNANVTPKRYNAYTERKRRSQMGNNVCPGGNFSQSRKRVHRTQTSHEKRVYRVKTSLARVKPRFLMAKIVLPSEIIASKVVSVFGRYTWFAFASDVSISKIRFFLCEHRFHCGSVFSPLRSVKAFLPYRETFSLGKNVFAFAVGLGNTFSP